VACPLEDAIIAGNERPGTAALCAGEMRCVQWSHALSLEFSRSLQQRRVGWYEGGRTTEIRCDAFPSFGQR
jgi:hypothetical protein